MHLLILASESPRRKEILKSAGYIFTTHPSQVSEQPNLSLSLDNQILDIAERKAKAAISSYAFENQNKYLILSGDTLVIIENEVLGKPESPKQAFDYLKKLSNQTHWVKTALCLVEWPSLKTIKSIDTSYVTFRNLSDQEILDYVATGEPMDKAGAYGLQGGGQKFVSDFKGSRDNIIGLPLHLFEKMLKENQWTISNKI